MIVLLAIFAWPATETARAQDAAVYYRQNCLSCHTIGGGPLAGPDLKDVSERQDREWLVRFMLDPPGVIASGDPYARKILEESRGVVMPAIPSLDRDMAERLLDLIVAESALETSQFRGLQLSTAPFTDADRQRGRDIFMGHAPLAAGGASCISCHSMHDTPALGGGQLGPDLTNVYERLGGRRATSAWLAAPGTETMLPIYKDRPLDSDEIHALTAYFEASAGQSEADPAPGRVTFLLLGLAVAAATTFAMDAIWRRRMRGVRRPLVNSSR